MTVFRLKQLLAQGVGAVLNLDQRIHARLDRYVLSFHRVLTTQQAQSEGVHHSLWISPQRLESLIKWMRSVGEIVDYTRIIDTSIACNRPLFTLTFDDGWKDNYLYALPILRQYEVPAHIFLATEAVNSGALFWPQDIASKTQRLLAIGLEDKVVAALFECWPECTRLINVKQANVIAMVECWIEALKLLNEDDRRQRINDYYRRLQLSTCPLTGYIMSWDELREMQKYGISFGSHTHHHTILEGLPSEQIEYELRQSRKLIEEKLQIMVNSFCYPNGRYNHKERSILATCGYRYGFRLDNVSLVHCTDFFYIPRFLVCERITAKQDFFKLCLLEAPLYRSKPHNPLWRANEQQ